MATMHWGRKETIIFAPHGAVYTDGAVIFAVILTGLFVYVHFTFGNTPLQRFYTPIYIRSSVAGGVSASRKDKYRFVMIGARGIRTRPATDVDVRDGNTPEPGTKPRPLALSQSALQAGYDLLYQDPERTYIDAPLSAYLSRAIYGGDTLFDIYQVPLFFGLVSLLIQLPFSIQKDIWRRKQMRYGRRLKGTERVTPKEFNRKVEGDGLGIKIDGLKDMLRIPAKAEAQHVQIIADSGGGKTTIIMQMLRQIRGRGDSAIVYDPPLEYKRRFYDPKHNIILNPLDRRCPTGDQPKNCGQVRKRTQLPSRCSSPQPSVLGIVRNSRYYWHGCAQRDDFDCGDERRGKSGDGLRQRRCSAFRDGGLHCQNVPSKSAGEILDQDDSGRVRSVDPTV